MNINLISFEFWYSLGRPYMKYNENTTEDYLSTVEYYLPKLFAKDAQSVEYELPKP